MWFQIGYGSRGLQALYSFYSGEYFDLDDTIHPEPSYAAAIDKALSIIFPQELCADVISVYEAIIR